MEGNVFNRKTQGGEIVDPIQYPTEGGKNPRFPRFACDDNYMIVTGDMPAGMVRQRGIASFHAYQCADLTEPLDWRDD